MTSLKSRPETRAYHQQAYQFVFAALRYTQEHLGRDATSEEAGHISGSELLNGIRELGLHHFGMLAGCVFKAWGIEATDDFGHVVFELIEAGEMRKTDDDQLTDFFDVYRFEDAFRTHYTLDLSTAFPSHD